MSELGTIRFCGLTHTQNFLLFDFVFIEVLCKDRAISLLPASRLLLLLLSTCLSWYEHPKPPKKNIQTHLVNRAPSLDHSPNARIVLAVCTMRFESC